MIDSNRRRPTVLLVHDDAQIRSLAAAAIAPMARVVEVPSAERAFAELDTELPDLIITDLRMLGMDGLEFCRRLRAEDSTCHLPVLVITEKGDERTLEGAYQAGATDFVHQPLAVETLHHRVRYLLRSAAGFRELCDSRTSLATAQRIARLGNWTYLAEHSAFVWSEEMFRIFNLDRVPTVALETRFTWTTSRGSARRCSERLRVRERTRSNTARGSGTALCDTCSSRPRTRPIGVPTTS